MQFVNNMYLNYMHVQLDPQMKQMQIWKASALPRYIFPGCPRQGEPTLLDMPRIAVSTALGSCIAQCSFNSHSPTHLGTN